MSISEMTAAELEKRSAEITAELEGATEERLAELNTEAGEIELRRKELADIEKREAMASAINSGEQSAKIIEERKENIMETKTYEKHTKEYRDAWLKMQAGAPMTAEERSAMATVDVVPTITENRIINRLKESPLLKYIDFTNFEGYVNIPNWTTNGAASWGASNEQQDAVGHVGLSLYQLIKTIEVPGKFAHNSIDAFEDYIVEGLTNNLESALQSACIVGAGSTEPTGIATTVSTATGTFTKAAITKADILKIMGSLGAQYQKEAVWIMPTKVLFECMAVADINGFAGLAADIGYQIGGKPVVVDDACIISSTDTIFYGCAKAYHMNVSGIEVAKDLSVGFKSNAVNFRAVCYGDGKLESASAFVKYTRAT